LLISFEGIDGCGKSTQIELLKESLSNKGLSVHIFREPGGTEISERVRSLLLHDTDEMNPVTELLLFSAARSQLISEKVVPLLNKEEIVVLDRFYDSTTAYQGYGRKSVPLNEIKLLNSIASHNQIPDITFYLRIDSGTAAQRTQSNRKDRMERSGDQFFESVISGYDEISKQENRFITIDATKTVEEIHKVIIKVVEAHL